MRILDVVLLEDKQRIYAIGDSHAKAIGTYGKFLLYAADGRSAFSEENLSAIDKVIPGSVVVLGAGTNDMANQNISSVIQRVEKLLTLLTNKKCTIWFVLPAATDSPQFIGYKDQLRNELAHQLPSDFPKVQLLDLGQLSIKSGDGIHAPQSWYQSAARTVAGSAKDTAGNDQSGKEVKSDDPLGDFINQKEKEKAEKPADQSGKKETPSPSAPSFEVPTGYYGEGIKRLQMALIALGYSVGPDKDDGKFGKNTRAAVLRFQKDHSLKETGLFDKETVDAINHDIAEKHKNHIKTTPDTRNSIQPGQSGKVPPGTKSTVAWQEVSSYLKSKGMDDQHRAGILANIQGESQFNVADQSGDKGTSWGLFQWQGSRRVAMIKAVPDWKTNWKGQIDFAIGEDVAPRYFKRSFGTAGEAAAWWCYHWERPKDKVGDSKKRAAMANNYL